MGGCSLAKEKETGRKNTRTYTPVCHSRKIRIIVLRLELFVLTGELACEFQFLMTIQTEYHHKIYEWYWFAMLFCLPEPMNVAFGFTWDCTLLVQSLLLGEHWKFCTWRLREKKTTCFTVLSRLDLTLSVPFDLWESSLPKKRRAWKTLINLTSASWESSVLILPLFYPLFFWASWRKILSTAGRIWVLLSQEC